MSNSKLILFLAVVGGLSACTAASHQEAHFDAKNADAHAHVSPAKVDAHAHVSATKADSYGHVATVKPGASVTMTSALPKFMTSGSFQSVQLSFDEAYNDGTMSVTIEPSEGLRLFGGTSSKAFDMTSAGTHIWNLDVQADNDGVYFLNVFAEAKGQFRSFSVRLDMGVVTQKMLSDTLPAEGELVDGGKIRVLDAEETIR